jgi:hypothetical protein
MECDMAKGRRKGGKGGKQRRWKAVRSRNPVEVILPPHIRSAMGERSDPRWSVAADQALVQCHERYDRGDKRAVLDAIEILSAFFPPWLREAYVAAWTAHRQYTVETLDQAFGIVRPKGLHLERARKREQLRWQIVLRVYCRHKQGEGAPLDNELFAVVGRELGISGGQAAKIFGEPESDELRELIRNLPVSD